MQALKTILTTFFLLLGLIAIISLWYVVVGAVIIFVLYTIARVLVIAKESE